MKETSYERLERGEPNIPMRYLKSGEYYQVMSELRSGINVGQYSWNLDQGTTELLLTRLPKYVVEPTERQIRMQRRREALSLINGEGKII